MTEAREPDSSLAVILEAVKTVSDIYAARCDIRRDDDWYLLKVQEELGELVQVWLTMSGRGRSKGRSEAQLRTDLADEAADLLAHVLLLADASGIDLMAALRAKWFRYLPEGHALREGSP